MSTKQLYNEKTRIFKLNKMIKLATGGTVVFYNMGVESQMLYFQSGSLLRGLGKQQRMA